MSSYTVAAEPTCPLAWRQDIQAPFTQYAQLLWSGLANETRTAYKSAVKTYEFFCSLEGLTAWPPSVSSLGQYITRRAWGGAHPRL
jgi:hypothetical protein